ncbi:methyltransferase domain-containing protein [Pseudomonas sp. UFMG81]|uniref:methyltransferase domain-containing protein n=1 Tax=Pseudomonas sp. UFMG81 TaxID=2745936 RepID=UPI00188F195D|nr:methyltransferase domain-containing protein [Pseudomonas sp. UFMG81]
MAPVPFSSKDGKGVRVLFVAQHPSLLSGWRSLIRQMNEDSRFIIKVLLCPFLHPLTSASATLHSMRQALIDENISFCTADAINPEHYRPHVAFLQNPYDETRPARFKSAALAQAGIRVAYIPYGLEMGGGAWNLKAQFDLPVQRQAWRIFARSERHKAMFAKYCRSGSNHVVVTGHPKFDNKPTEATQSLPAQPLFAAKSKGRRTILWTPHFSVTQTPAWSTFTLYSETIFETFAKRPDLFLLVRPHPLFYKAMRDNGHWTEDGEATFRQMLEYSENMALDDTPDYQSAFNASSALMTDVGSFLLEYLATDKPLLYLHHPEGLGMNDDSALVESLYKAAGTNDIINFVNMIAAGEDDRLNMRLRAKSEFLFGLNENIAKNICDIIYDSLHQGDDWSPAFDPSHSDSQLKSENYWRESTTTYLAPPEYYEKKTLILEEQLSKLKNIHSAIDIGCGDGKYSLQIAKHAKRVQAYELSANLVAQAHESAQLNNAKNITFIQNELDDIAPFEKFDLISCLGVTSCVIDSLKFIHFLQRLKSLAKPGATLMLIDSLSTAADQFAEDQSGYQACYRSISDYKTLVTQLGFELSEEILITEARERQLVNKLFIFKAIFSS